MSVTGSFARTGDGTVKTVDDFGHLVMDPTFGPVYYVYLIDLEDAIFSMRK